MAALDTFSIPKRVLNVELNTAIMEGFVRGITPIIKPTEEEVKRALKVLGMDEETVCCAYCGEPADSWCPINTLVEPDGLITGYYYEIHNLVPTCTKCYHGRKFAPWREWIESDGDDSPKSRGIEGTERRIARLEKYEERYKPRKFDTRMISALPKWNQYWKNCRIIREMITESEDLGEQLAYKLKSRADKEIERQRADRQRDRKIALGIDDVRAMAEYYYTYFSQPDNDLDIDHFEERWSGVGFKMDYGESFVEEFTWDAFLKLDKLKEIIGNVCDVQQLGDAIYSEWRYITQVSNSHTEEETEWLLIALDRLIKISF